MSALWSMDGQRSSEHQRVGMHDAARILMSRGGVDSNSSSCGGAPPRYSFSVNSLGSLAAHSSCSFLDAHYEPQACWVIGDSPCSSSSTLSKFGFGTGVGSSGGSSPSTAIPANSSSANGGSSSNSNSSSDATCSSAPVRFFIGPPRD